MHTKTFNHEKGLQAAGHNVSAAAIIQLKVSSLIKINWHEHYAPSNNKRENPIYNIKALKDVGRC